MSEAGFSSYGVFGILDSGIPSNSTDYTTLVVFHGFGWHSGGFSRFLPFAKKYNARIVLVNRRDYPGATPYSEEERKTLESISSMADNSAQKALLDFMKARAREVYNFLTDFVTKEDIPVSDGLVVAGWSFGVSVITGFLANVASFPSNDVELRKYIKKVVLYDGPYHTLGYPPPPEQYNPLFDPELPPGEGPKLFPAWVSGYYNHGDSSSSSSLEYRNALPEPSPTILTLSPTQVQSCLELGPTLPGGSDDVLLKLGIKHGVFSYLKDAALYLSDSAGGTRENEDEDGPTSNEWDDLELQYVWCDQSVWEMPWGTWALQAQIDEGQKAGKAMRKVVMIKLRGANHFYHWDQPELSLKAILLGA